VLIRMQGPGDNFSQRRFMAIFDRSNVFLPPRQARDGRLWTEPFVDNQPANGVYDPGESFTDLNHNGYWDFWDDSGEMLRFDPAGTIWGPTSANPDPDFFDRTYVTPKVVAVQTVTE